MKRIPSIATILPLVIATLLLSGCGSSSNVPPETQASTTVANETDWDQFSWDDGSVWR